MCPHRRAFITVSLIRLSLSPALCYQDYYIIDTSVSEVRACLWETRRCPAIDPSVTSSPPTRSLSTRVCFYLASRQITILLLFTFTSLLPGSSSPPARSLIYGPFSSLSP